MSEPFLGEIKGFGFGWAPKDYALCNGATVNISGNEALYSLLGTQFGGNGTTNFGLPDLRGRVILGTGTLLPQGHMVGAETITLTPNELPQHRHGLNCSGESPDASSPFSALPATLPDTWLRFKETDDRSNMHASSVQPAGEGGGHENRQPYTVISYCIAMRGIYPQRP